MCTEHGKPPTAEHGHGARWQVRYRDANHNQRAENFHRKPEADARAKLIGGEQVRGEVIDPAAGKVTFRTFAEDWRAARTHDPATAGRVERELRNHVYPVIGARSMRELAARPSLIQAWIGGIALAPSSARQVIKDVSAVFGAAVDDGIVARNPLRARSITRPKVPESKPEPWTLGRVDAVAVALAGERDRSRYAVLPYLGVGTGARQGELFGLAVDDVDFLRRMVHIRRQVRLIGSDLVFAPVKNDKAHDVPLSATLAPMLTEHIRAYTPAAVTLPWRRPDGDPVTVRLLLTRPGGLALHRSRFNESVWRPALKAAGVEPGRRNGCHVLRHTAASAWLAAGVDVVTVAAFLGDTVATVLNTYAHLMPDGADRAREAMDAFLSGEQSARNVHAKEAR